MHLMGRVAKPLVSSLTPVPPIIMYNIYHIQYIVTATRMVRWGAQHLDRHPNSELRERLSLADDITCAEMKQVMNDDDDNVKSSS